MNEWDWELGSLVVLSGQGLEEAHMGGEGRGSKQRGLSPTEARSPFLSYIRPLITISLEQRNLVLYNKITKKQLIHKRKHFENNKVG